MVACLCLELSKLPDEIWCLPYDDALLVWRELEQGPPVRTLVAQYLGYKPPRRTYRDGGRAAAAAPNADDFMQMQKVMGPSRPLPEHLKEAIKWAESMKKKHPALKTE
jgi:hypothetical protein